MSRDFEVGTNVSCEESTVCPRTGLIFVHVAFGHGSVLLCQGDEIPRGRAIFGIFFRIHNALHSVALGTHAEMAEPIEMPFETMSGLGRGTVLRGVTTPKGKG